MRRAMDGSYVRQLTSDDADHEDPAWSPDGSRVAFVLRKDSLSRSSIILTELQWSRSLQLRLEQSTRVGRQMGDALRTVQTTTLRLLAKTRPKSTQLKLPPAVRRSFSLVGSTLIQCGRPTERCLRFAECSAKRTRRCSWLMVTDRTHEISPTIRPLTAGPHGRRTGP